MKVQELRQLLRASDREHLENAFVESYKQLRKGQKEEIDPVITDILEGKTAEKKKRGSVIDFSELEQEIPVFIENAYAQNYFAPNRIIPKSQRPRWRFLVKNYIKGLEKVVPESENYPKAVKLLTDLYSLICEACNYYLFSTDDPFRSIGWKQYEFFELVVKRTFASGYSAEDISRLLLSATSGGLSRESLHIKQEIVLLGALKTSDVKYIAIEEAKKLVENKAEKLAGLGKYDSHRYDIEEVIEELCRMILLISIELSEAEKGVQYFFKNGRERDKEITLYHILDTIDWMEEDNVWMEAYEYGVTKKKVKPRDSLRKKYKQKKGQASV